MYVRTIFCLTGLCLQQNVFITEIDKNTMLPLSPWIFSHSLELMALGSVGWIYSGELTEHGTGEERVRPFKPMKI